MKSSTLKRVIVCLLLFIIGGIGGYFFAHHQFHNRAIEENFLYRPHFESLFSNTISDIRHREKYMEDMFNLEKEFFENEEQFGNNLREDLDQEYQTLQDFSGTESQSNGLFRYYQKSTINGEESSYNVNGKWNDGKNGGNMVMNGTNRDGKQFNYSGTIHDGKLEGIFVDEDGNTRSLTMDQLNLQEVYNNSNTLAE